MYLWKQVRVSKQNAGRGFYPSLFLKTMKYEGATEKKHEGRMTIKRGQKVWEINPKNRECTEVIAKNASYESRERSIGIIVRQAEAKQGMVYIVAINKANALRKMDKMFSDYRQALLNHIKQTTTDDIQPGEA